MLGLLFVAKFIPAPYLRVGVFFGQTIKFYAIFIDNARQNATVVSLLRLCNLVFGMMTRQEKKIMAGTRRLLYGF